MSYISKRPSGVRVPRAAVGDWWDELLALATGGSAGVLIGQVDTQCEASAQSQQSLFDAQISDVENNWRPSGYYSPTQMNQVIQYAGETLRLAGKALDTALAEVQLPSHREALMKARAKTLADDVNAMPYANAVVSARAQGIDVIDSTGLKRWVVNVLKVTREARFTSTMVACARPAYLSVLEALNTAAEALISLVKTIVGVVVDVGEAVLKIPDLLGTLFTYGKWVLLVGGAYYVGVKTSIIPQDPFGLR